MSTTGSRSGAANRAALPLMVVAFLAVIGFLYWLNISGRASTVVVEEAPEEAGPAARAVTLQEFATNPASYEGQEIRLARIPVTSRLGEQAFWTTQPNETPYLIRIGPEMIAGGFGVLSGDVAEVVVGSVHTMSDSVLAAWEAEGVLVNDIQRIEAEFATSFFEASQIELVPPGSSGDR